MDGEYVELDPGSWILHKDGVWRYELPAKPKPLTKADLDALGKAMDEMFDATHSSHCHVWGSIPAEPPRYSKAKLDRLLPPVGEEGVL